MQCRHPFRRGRCLLVEPLRRSLHDHLRSYAPCHCPKYRATMALCRTRHRTSFNLNSFGGNFTMFAKNRLMRKKRGCVLEARDPQTRNGRLYLAIVANCRQSTAGTTTPPDLNNFMPTVYKQVARNAVMTNTKLLIKPRVIRLITVNALPGPARIRGSARRSGANLPHNHHYRGLNMMNNASLSAMVTQGAQNSDARLQAKSKAEGRDSRCYDGNSRDKRRLMRTMLDHTCIGNSAAS
ncbi:hypothetical protein TcasGA2_TC007610 [Tribolium castaneum]|uniref:Uncharacterized protein n=1 Tax=Tribolium castaneum TaxID=7070 RepID=D2A2X4_TRICA|nr:hypothetical protein TcasGA2_TC007610 [Tribolium castaneum]